MSYEIEIKPECRWNIENIVGLLLSLLACIISSTYLIKMKQVYFESLVWMCLVLTLLYSIFFLFLANLIFVRKHWVAWIASRNLELKISAFMGIETKREEEETQC